MGVGPSYLYPWPNMMLQPSPNTQKTTFLCWNGTAFKGTYRILPLHLRDARNYGNPRDAHYNPTRTPHLPGTSHHPWKYHPRPLQISHFPRQFHLHTLTCRRRHERSGQSSCHHRLSPIHSHGEKAPRDLHARCYHRLNALKMCRTITSWINYVYGWPLIHTCQGYPGYFNGAPVNIQGNFTGTLISAVLACSRFAIYLEKYRVLRHVIFADKWLLLFLFTQLNITHPQGRSAIVLLIKLPEIVTESTSLHSDARWQHPSTITRARVYVFV